jgi:hypothetical protein
VPFCRVHDLTLDALIVDDLATNVDGLLLAGFRLIPISRTRPSRRSSQQAIVTFNVLLSCVIGLKLMDPTQAL